MFQPQSHGVPLALIAPIFLSRIAVAPKPVAITPLYASPGASFWLSAARRAFAASVLSITRLGVQSSIPFEREVDAMLEVQP